MRLEQTLLRLCLISALTLAVSFVLPLSEVTTYLNTDGTPIGLLGQWFPSPDQNSEVSRHFFWQEPGSVLPLVFFVPLISVAAKYRGVRRWHKYITLCSPILAGFFLMPLFGSVLFCEFSLVPGGGPQRSYGGYVALASLLCFFAASCGLLVAGFRWRVARPAAETPR
jgi:hypothetical protein